LQGELFHCQLLEVTLGNFIFPPNAKAKKKGRTDNGQGIGFPRRWGVKGPNLTISKSISYEYYNRLSQTVQLS
jgi:hypothetical protein